MGLHDGNLGVQWNAWIEWTDPQTTIANVGVNLEGMKYSDWPIAKLIRQELKDPWLFEAKERVANPNLVLIALQRHAWQAAGRVQNYREQHILPPTCTLAELTPEQWLRSLLEAQACLATSDGGRTTQRITLKDGRQVERAVSPYLNFHRAIEIDADQSVMRDTLQIAMEDLRPLYEFVVDRTAG